MITKSKNNLVLMYLIVFLQGFVFYGPYATLYRVDRGIDTSQIFLIEAIYMIFAITLEIPWGYIADKFGYKRTLIISNAFLMLSKIVFLYANTFSAFLFERFLTAVAFSGISGCDRALIYNSIQGKDSTKVFGRYAAAGTFGFLCASILSSFIVKVSLDATALLTIPPHILALILSFFLVDVKKETTDKVMNLLSTLKAALANKQLMLLAIFFSIFINVSQAVCVFLSQLKYEEVGIKITYFGVITAIIQVAKILSLKSHVLEKKVKATNSIFILTSIVLLCVVVLIFIQNVFVTILCVMCVATAVAMIIPIYSSIQNNLIENQNRATMLSCYAMIESIGAILFYMIISWFSSISLEVSFISIAILSSLGIVLFYKYNRLYS